MRSVVLWRVALKTKNMIGRKLPTANHIIPLCFLNCFLYHSKNPCSNQVSKLWLLFAEAALTYGKFQLHLTSNPTNNWYCLHVSIICRHVNHNLFSISFVFSTQHAFHFYRWINCHNTLLWSHILSKLGAGSKSWWKLPGFTPPPPKEYQKVPYFSAEECWLENSFFCLHGLKKPARGKLKL